MKKSIHCLVGLPAFQMFFICAFVLLPLLGSTQQKILKFDTYSKTDGLLHSYVLDVFQDSEGYVWIGSYGGLNRYDGINLTNYTNRTAIQLPTNVIHDIIEPEAEKGKALWLATDNGLVKLHKPTMSFTHYPLKDCNVMTIVETHDGFLWLGTDKKGLMQFDLNSGKYDETALTKKADMTWGEEIKTIHKDNLGNLWIGATDAGLLLYNPADDTYERYANLAGNGEGQTINCIYKYQKNLLLGTTDKGLFLFRKNKQSFAAVEDQSGAPYHLFPSIAGIAPDREGDLWVATRGGGLFELRLKDRADQGPVIVALDQYTKNACSNQGISSNVQELLYKDQTGNLWIGTLGGGLSKIDFFNHKFDHYKIQRGLDDFTDRSTVLSIGQNAEGELWYGTQADGVYRFSTDLKLISHVDLDGPNSSQVVRQIYRDHKDRMWVTVDGGIYLMSGDASKMRYFSLAAHGLVNANIHAVCVDDQDRLWLGVYDRGVYRTQLSADPFGGSSDWKFTRYFEHPDDGYGNLSSNGVWTLYKDLEGQIWVGTDRGLDVYGNQNGADAFKNVLKGNISAIAEPTASKTNSMWIGTYGDGVYLMSKDDYSTINYSTDNGFSNNNINGILEDGNGKIWVGTEKGICSIDPSGYYNTELSQLTDQQVNSSRVVQYLIHDGLQGHEFHLNANEKDQTGKLFFGGPNGLNIFDPQNIIVNSNVFPAKINDFKINNVSITTDTARKVVPEYMDSIQLAFADNFFTIEFNQVCLSTPERASYWYLLEGYDSDWIETDALHTRINYTGIPAGDYVMKIKAFNPDGFESDQVTSLNIHIDPPWYETIWFRFCMLIAFAGLIYVAYLRVVNAANQKRQRDLKKQEEAFNQEKLEADLEYKNRELAASAMYLINRNEKLIEIKGLVEDVMRKTGTKNSPELNKIVMTVDHVLKHKDDWEKFEKNFNRIDTNFTQRLLEAYPRLSTNDIKICTYMRMNLSSKEIAGLLNITTKSLETSRLRIRKKIELDTSVYLSDFILKF